MHGRWLATMLMAALLVLGTGCESVQYQMHAPLTDAGRSCITQCGATVETCRGNELRRMRITLEACERRAESGVRLCLVDADSADKKRLCELSRISCMAAETTVRCEIDHRTCFVRCGGTVDKVVRDR